MKKGMGTYKIDDIDLFTSIKDLVWPKILDIEGHHWHAILPAGH